MLEIGDVLEMRAIKIKLTVIKVSQESLDLEFELGANSGGTPVHTHPNAVEVYEVLKGKFDAYLNGIWKTYDAGEKIVIEKGVPHTFRNSSEKITPVLNSHRPALRMGAYFEGLHKIMNSGVLKNGQMNLKALMYLSLLMSSFKDEIRPVAPPPPVTRVFGFFGRLAGYKI